MRLLTISLLFIFVADGCIEPMDVAYGSERRIVVDGMITDQPGPYIIKINRTSSSDEFIQFPKPVEKAVVKIIDDLGNEEQLIEKGGGEYETVSMQGKVGRSYQLKFSTSDSQTYESSFEKIEPAGEITDMRFTFHFNAINVDDQSKINDVVRVFFDSKGTPGAPNLFRWRWSGTYEVETRPDLRTKLVSIGPESPPMEVPDPLPCSGLIARPDFTVVVTGPCECCHCWIDEFSDQAIVSNTSVFQQSDFKNIAIGELPVIPRRFQVKYYFKVEQLSLSENAYRFWRNLESQQRGSQNIFQPNAIRLRGNLVCTSDPGQEVSGIFSAAGVASAALFIPRTAIPRPLQFDYFLDDCRTVAPGASNVKPPFW